MQAGHVMPQSPAASFPAGTGLQTQPELTVAYALPPNQPSGYLVHGDVTGKYRKSCTRKKECNIFVLPTCKSVVTEIVWY